ncbi:hydroxypyruvate isomerase family protein [Daejeonella sp.]|jgi:hydroxypyruvate isomerase|uniref:hydroxypyruvate isomerase family protein n=1 Tax=Daejeonella sp. TaxID=2805397 RepID=UPI0037BE6EB5
MNRSEFIKSSGLLGLSLAAGFSAQASNNKGPEKAEKTFNLDYAPHAGMFAAHAGNNFIDQIKFMHDQGFRSIEDNGMMGRPIAMQEEIGNTLAKLGMTMGVFVVDKGGNGANTLAAGRQEYIDIFLKGCRQAVDVAKRVNAKWVTVVPGDFERNLPIGIQTGNVIEALRRGAEILEPHGLIMVLEPLSDTPNLFLRNTDQTHLICKGVNSPSCKILYDIYHMQKNEGNLIPTMEKCWDEIAYIQIGDNPGRREPTTGEINYRNVFKYIDSKGYKGVLGMEHGNSLPGKEGELALIKAYREVDGFK